MTSFHDQLKQQVKHTPASMGIILISILVFLFVLANGGGVWHSSSAIILHWGANFSPATQDNEWWRMGTAIFLHFGILHLALNMWALWDGSQWVERIYGHWRFLLIFLLAGLIGNLFSLVFHVGVVISAGASSGIFGVYGSLLGFLWLNRSRIPLSEYRWLFFGAGLFSLLTILFGLLVEGIDNAAHIGGLVAGMMIGIVLLPKSAIRPSTIIRSGICIVFLGVASGLLINLPNPSYYWSDEKAVQKGIADFVGEEVLITEEWNQLLDKGMRGEESFSVLAERLEADVARYYSNSFEVLSALPRDKDLPSAELLEKLRLYTESKRDASRNLVEQWRNESSYSPENNRSSK